jgi:hypothetical protein
MVKSCARFLCHSAILIGQVKRVRLRIDLQRHLMRRSRRRPGYLFLALDKWAHGNRSFVCRRELECEFD